MNLRRDRLFAASMLLIGSTSLLACPPVGSEPCTTDADCPSGRCRRGACGPICRDDTECGSEQICSDGACVPRPQCAQDEDCASGFVCREGRCACTGDSACALNQSCVDGACRTRARCRTDEDCDLEAPGHRCEVTQGLCIAPCVLASDCAPGLDPQVASLVYTCSEGACLRRCVNDATCGAGLVCEAGSCAVAACQTFADCPEGQYCTSATNGRCLAYQTCDESTQCPPNFECRPFTQGVCPPGFPCATSVCQELPRCLADADCSAGPPGQAPSYCEDFHCQRTSECDTSTPCGSGRVCVGGLCVPDVCRGATDCPSGQVCSDGRCGPLPAAADIERLELYPSRALLTVGSSAQFRVIAFALGGTSAPYSSPEFSIVDDTGQPSTLATVDANGLVTAAAPGEAKLRVRVNGSHALAQEAPLRIHPPVSAGRRVIVIDAITENPVAGTLVRGCDDPPSDSACPSPVDLTTDAQGVALFASFVGPRASFSVASTETRADGSPRFDRVSILSTTADDVLVPLTPNPVEAAAGFRASISFGDVHSTGPYWAGYAVLSVKDPSEIDLRQLLGEPFNVTIPGTSQQVPVPGSVVLYTSPGFGIPQELKGQSLGLGQPGRSNAVAFAGRTSLEQALLLRSTDFLAYTSAFDYALHTNATVTMRPRVPDATDIDADGLCEDSSKCPDGSEEVPDYASFAPLSFTPRREQKMRTEVVVPHLPVGLDTVVVATTWTLPRTGALPLGLSSSVGGPPEPDGTRPVDAFVLKSGAPYAGLEAGVPAIWAIATAALQTSGFLVPGAPVSGRIARDVVLSPRVALAPFLPLPGGSYLPGTRTFSPSQPRWSTLAAAGAALARVVIVSPQGRHVAYIALEESQTSLRLPEGAPSAGLDPADHTSTRFEVTAFDLSGDATADEVFGLPGLNLVNFTESLDGYSRSTQE